VGSSGSVLFNVFVKELDAGIEWTLSKSANDNNLRCVESLKGREVLQRGVHRQESQAIMNCMKFNKSKRWIIHLG